MSDADAVLKAAGLPSTELAAWNASEAEQTDSVDAAAAAMGAHLAFGEDLLERLPARSDRTDAEAGAAAVLQTRFDTARSKFLRAHTDAVYAALTDDLRRPVRDEELVYAAAERFPGLVPTRAQMAVERARSLPDKDGIEIAQGLFLSFVLASPRCGAHLVWSMLRPTDAALERLDEFRATGVADLGGTFIERRGRAAYIEIRNDRHLNAEDCDTLPTTEAAVDLALLDPGVEVGVIRGAVVSHPR